MAGASTKVIYAALIGNSLIAVTKLGAAAFTGSSAMFSEGIHSLVDTGNQLLLLFGLRQSRKPPDDQFPFGHGKEIYFWSFVVAILIFALGSGISIYEGVSHLLSPAPMENVLVNYIVLGLAIVFEGFAWWFAFREFDNARGRLSHVQAVRQGKDPTLFVVLFEDSAAMLGLLVALGGIAIGQLTGNPYLDGAASVIIGLILGATAIWLAWETKSLLIGESADPRIVAAIRSLLAERPEIQHVNEVLTLHMGPEYILVNISIDFYDQLTAEHVESTIAGLDADIKAANPQVKRIFIEAESRRTEKPAPTSD